MKIYVVTADNGWAYEDHCWWNVAAFASKEAAKEYICKLPSLIGAADARIDELDEIMDNRELTDLEKKELKELKDKWGCYWHFFDHGFFEIEEYELQE